MRKISVLFIMLVAAVRCGSQPLQLAFSIVQTSAGGKELCLDLRAGTRQPINSLQFGICWDPALLTYKGSDTGVLNDLAISDLESMQGMLRVSWYDGTGTSIKLPDTSVLLRLYFVQYPCTAPALVSVCDLENLPIEAGSVGNTTIEIQHKPIEAPFPVYYFEKNICAGEFLDLNGKKIWKTGLYTDTLHTLSGCDSIVKMALTAHSPAFSEIHDTLPPSGTCSFQGRKIDRPGQYAVVLKTRYGCDSTLVLHLTERRSSFFIPNVFRPGASGINGQFGISGPSDLSVLTLDVFDRWGNLVFRGRHLLPDGCGWDGGISAEGIYTWYCETRLPGQNPVKSAGQVTLVR